MSKLIPPHGGELVSRLVNGKLAHELLELCQQLHSVDLSPLGVADVECIATGVYSPLTGFMVEEDYNSVVKNMKLANGLVWSIPVTLMVNSVDGINVGEKIALRWEDQVIAVMDVQSIYRPDKKWEAQNVYRTKSKSHPGVKRLFETGEWYLGGPIELITKIPHTDFHEIRLTPAETREIFRTNGWKTIVAFQTRNPIHRAHEYLQKTALEMVDGLFVNPLVGQTKSDDIPSDVRIETYKVILEKYYPKNRVLLGVFPAAMRYAGPREAIMHAIARKNYGCTHFIVGRDHAGVGKYYGTYDAQEIFELFSRDEIGIIPLKFEHAFYCNKCSQMGSNKTCPHSADDRVFLSGTKVRSMLFEGQMPPKEFTRPEVAKILIDATQRQKAGALKKGVTIWFTGLSGAGKSTIANRLQEELTKHGRKPEILDGDIIRQNLTKGLGFSKEDRDENVRRIGFVSSLLTRNGATVIVAAISPYREIRDEVRSKVGNFVEVFVDAPVEVCEQRDVKGLYERARRGEIKNFTGISDPYERPLNPEVTCSTDKETVDESVAKVVEYLKSAGYL